MKLTNGQIQSLAQKVLEQWKQNKIIEFRVDEKVILQKILEVIKGELQKDLELEREVNKMLDGLERSNPGEFQRYKMYPLLKQKLAKEKKIVL